MNNFLNLITSCISCDSCDKQESNEISVSEDIDKNTIKIPKVTVKQSESDKGILFSRGLINISTNKSDFEESGHNFQQDIQDSDCHSFKNHSLKPRRGKSFHVRGLRKNLLENAF